MTEFFPVGRTDSSFKIYSSNLNDWAAICAAVADYCNLEISEEEALKRVDLSVATYEDSTFDVVTIDGVVVGSLEEPLIYDAQDYYVQY